MNVTCGSCQAKYAVADEKVQRRKVKIVCKRCQSALVIDGTQTPATVTTVKAGANVAAPGAAGAGSGPATPASAGPTGGAHATPPPAPSAQKRTMMGGLTVQPAAGAEPGAPPAGAPHAEPPHPPAHAEPGAPHAGAPHAEPPHPPAPGGTAPGPTPTPPPGRHTPRPPTRPRHQAEDERDLLGLTPKVEVPDAPPDSLVNLTAGGLFTPPAMAAPDFSAPVVEPPRSGRAEPPARSGRAGLLVGGALLAAGAVALFVLKPPALFGRPAPAAPPAATAEPVSATTGPTTTAEATATAAAATATAAATAAAPSASAAPAVSVAAAAEPRAGEPTGRAEERPASTATATATTTATTATAAAATTTAPPPSDLPPFDQGAARAALGSAAGSAGSCKQPDGPTGSGKVSVTFAPSGRATNAVVSGSLAGTAVGGCVARIFRGARVPPFSGDPVTVGKSFSVE